MPTPETLLYLLLAPEGIKLLLSVLLILVCPFHKQVDQLLNVLLIEQLQEGILLG